MATITAVSKKGDYDEIVTFYLDNKEIASFMNIEYECSDARAVRRLLTKLHELGVLDYIDCED